MRTVHLAAGAVIGLLATVAGCGSGDRTFTASELVSELKASGLEVTLGKPLPNDQEDLEVYGITFQDSSGGSLIIAPDSETAEAEYARCEDAVNLLCYRAANALMLLEETEREAEITAAFQRLADE